MRIQLKLNVVMLVLVEAMQHIATVGQSQLGS
jgi:hypothetical protein